MLFLFMIQTIFFVLKYTYVIKVKLVLYETIIKCIYLYTKILSHSDEVITDSTIPCIVTVLCQCENKAYLQAPERQSLTPADNN